MATATELQQLYVAYFGRPADPAGLDYWVSSGISTKSFAAVMFAQPEFQSVNSGLSVETQVNKLYINLFGRPADATGLLYWTNKINTGQIALASVANDLIFSATNSGAASAADLAALNSKTSTAVSYTAGLRTAGAALLAYQPQSTSPWISGANFAAAVSFMTTATATNIPTAAQITASVVSVGEAGTQGKTFALTIAADTVTGGADNDTIVANVTADAAGAAENETLNSNDTIDGGAGSDTLTYYTAGTVAALPAAKITNVETINIVSTGAVTADTSVASITGVSTITAKAVGAAVNIDTKADVTSVTVTGSATTVAIDDNGTATTDVLTTVSVTGNTGDLTIGAGNSTDKLTSLTLVGSVNGDATVTAAAGTRSLALTLNGVTGPANDVVVTDDTATTLTVSGTGAASTGVDLQADAATTISIAADEKITFTAIDASAAKTLTVTGDSLVTFTTNTATDLAALTTVTSANSTGGLVLTTELATGVAFTGGAGADSIGIAATTKTHTMGAGIDTVTASADFGTGGTVDAGDGIDTLKMTATLAANDSLSANTTFAAKISNFETLSLTGTNVTKTINLANLDNLSTVSLAAGATAITLANLASGGTVNALGANTAVVVNVKDATIGGNLSDVLNYNTTIATSGASVNFGTLTAAGVETVNLDTTRTGTAVAADENRVDLTLANTVTLNVTGNVIADIDGAALTSATLQTINAATNTGGLKVTTAGATQGIAITGSATKANTITGGNGGDTITGGSGVDTITSGTGANVISAGAGNDTITFTMQVVAGDTMTGGAGNDTYVMATTTAATFTKHTITDFNLGTSTTAVDDIQVSITAVEGLTTVTDLVDTTANSAAATNGTVVKLGTDGATIANADLVVIDTATFADTTAMLAGLKTGGAATITYGATLSDNDAFLIAFSDGTHSYIAVATAGAANLTTSEGVDSVEIIAQLSGINLAGLANLDSLDYSVIA